jgi:hypothetical protein
MTSDQRPLSLSVLGGDSFGKFYPAPRSWRSVYLIPSGWGSSFVALA